MTTDTKKSSGRARSIRERLGEDAYQEYRKTGTYDDVALNAGRERHALIKQAGPVEPSEIEKELLQNHIKATGKTVEQIAAANSVCARVAAWVLTS